MENTRKEEKWRLTLPFITVTFLSLLMTCCLQMTVSAMPKFVVSLGIEKSLAGSATTACTIVSLLFRPFAAKITDNHGGKFTAIGGTMIYVAVFVSYFFCNNIALLLVLRAFQGMGMSMITTALGTVATSLVPQSDMTRGMSYFSLGNAVALSIGPALGLWLVENFSYGGMFAFGAAASLLAIALLLVLKNDHPGTHKKQNTQAKRETKAQQSFLEKAKASGAIQPSAILIIMILCQTSLSTYLSFFVEQLDFVGAGSFFALNVFGMVASKFILGKACDKFGEFAVTICSGALLASAYLFVAIMPVFGPACITAGGIVYGFGYGGFYSLLNAAAVKKSAASNRGTANSLFFGAKDVGTAVGSLAWGGIAVIGYGPMYLVATILIVCATVAYLRLLRKERAMMKKYTA